MSNAFMKLHDFALSRGLLDSTPEFGRELQEATEKIVALAKRSDEEVKDEDENPADSSAGLEDPSSALVAPNASSTSGSDIVAIAPTEPATLGGDAATTSSETVVSRTTGYEVVTHPTAENASFPYGTSGSCEPRGFASVPSPYRSVLLPPPETFGHNEISFGRRLQRSTLEQALALVDAPGIHPEMFGRIFGFCLLFENRNKIKRRLTNALSMTIEETLHNWRFPFLHLGGAGTFLPRWQGADRTLGLGSVRPRIGNEGTQAPLRPINEAGYSFGPFDSVTAYARDESLGSSHRIQLPGFEGDFFDPDEVDHYLRQRGVNIPPLADYVTVEIDLNSFPDETGSVPDWISRELFGRSTNRPSVQGHSLNQGSLLIAQATAASAAAETPPSLNPGSPKASNFIDEMASAPAGNGGGPSTTSGMPIDHLLLTPPGTVVMTPNYDLGAIRHSVSSEETPATAAMTSDDHDISTHPTDGIISSYYFPSLPPNFLDEDLFASFGRKKQGDDAESSAGTSTPRNNYRRVITLNVAIFINGMFSHFCFSYLSHPSLIRTIKKY